MSQQGCGEVRVRMPDRKQVLMRVECDNELIPKAHQAQVTWEVPGELDLSAFYQPIEARDGVAGRGFGAAAASGWRAAGANLAQRYCVVWC